MCTCSHSSSCVRLVAYLHIATGDPDVPPVNVCACRGAWPMRKETANADDGEVRRAVVFVLLLLCTHWPSACISNVAIPTGEYWLSRSAGASVRVHDARVGIAILGQYCCRRGAACGRSSRRTGEEAGERAGLHKAVEADVGVESARVPLSAVRLCLRLCAFWSAPFGLPVCAFGFASLRRLRRPQSAQSAPSPVCTVCTFSSLHLRGSSWLSAVCTFTRSAPSAHIKLLDPAHISHCLLSRPRLVCRARRLPARRSSPLNPSTFCLLTLALDHRPILAAAPSARLACTRPSMPQTGRSASAATSRPSPISREARRHHRGQLILAVARPTSGRQSAAVQVHTCKLSPPVAATIPPSPTPRHFSTSQLPDAAADAMAAIVSSPLCTR